jgi:hypothetical protein
MDNLSSFRRSTLAEQSGWVMADTSVEITETPPRFRAHSFLADAQRQQFSPTCNRHVSDRR